MKVCSKCGKEEHHAKGLCTSCYHKQDYIKNGMKEYYEVNKEKLSKQQKEYNKNNKEKRKLQDKKYYQEHKEQEIKRSKKWHQDNRELHKQNMKKWHKNNPNYDTIYYRNRIKTDIGFRVKQNLSCRLQIAVKNQGSEKSFKTIKLIGCTIQQLIEHLNKTAPEGITVKDIGQYKYHIDHIIPCASFDLTKESEQLKCFHYTNLRLLWWEENLEKSNKILVEVETQ